MTPSPPPADPAPPRPAWRHLVLLLIVISAAGVRALYIDRPFARDDEGTGSFFAIMARIYFRPQPGAPTLIPVIGQSPADGAVVTYANHPPAIPLLIAMTYGAFGYDGGHEALPPDWQTRLPAVPFALGSIVLVYALVRGGDGGNTRAALLAAALLAAMPMMQVFGGHPDVINPQLIFFVLLTLKMYLRLIDEPGPAALAKLSLAFIGAAATDWPAFYLVPIFALHFVSLRPRQWAYAAVFCGVAGVVFLLIYIHLSLAHEGWLWMFEKVARRSSSVSDWHGEFTLAGWLDHAVLNHAVRHLTPVPIGMMIAWLLLMGWRSGGPGRRATLLLIGWAAIHIGVGRQGVYQHAWWWWPAAPAVAAGAALLGERLLKHLRNAAVANAVATVAMVAFSLFYGVRVYRELFRANDMPEILPAYTIAEIGSAIRAATPPGEVVAVAEGDPSVSLWHYGDRPLIRVWTPPDLDRLMSTGAAVYPVELPFGYEARWNRPPRALVIPRGYQPWAAELIDHATVHFPAVELPQPLSGKFLAFDLSRPIGRPGTD